MNSDRFLASLCFGLAALFTAVAAGVPIWRHWLPGDATDIAVMVGLGVDRLIGALRPRSEGTPS